jgi:hypothetical protein
MFKIGDHVWYILGGFKYEGIIQKKGSISNVYHLECSIWKVKLNKVKNSTLTWKESDLELQRKAHEYTDVNEKLLNKIITIKI